MSLAVSLRLTPWCEQPYVLREEPGEGTIRAWRGTGTLGWRPPFSTKVSAGWPCDTGAGLSAVRAAAARHHFQTLDFLAHGFIEDGVGQEDQPVRAGVGVSVLTGFPWTEYARLCGVHSLESFLWAGLRGCSCTCGAIPLSD